MNWYKNHIVYELVLSLYGKDAEISASVRIYVRDRTFTYVP